MSTMCVQGCTHTLSLFLFLPLLFLLLPTSLFLPPRSPHRLSINYCLLDPFPSCLKSNMPTVEDLESVTPRAVAAARYKRNHEFIAELFSPFPPPTHPPMGKDQPEEQLTRLRQLIVRNFPLSALCK